jgi:hypothetical protein
MNDFYFEYKNVVDAYALKYIKEFGERKAKAINEKVMTSNKISGLISKSRHERIPISARTYLYTLNSIPYFVFSRGQTQALAALLSLDRWHIEVNTDLKLLNSGQLLALAKSIIRDCEVTYI